MQEVSKAEAIQPSKEEARAQEIETVNSASDASSNGRQEFKEAPVDESHVHQKVSRHLFRRRPSLTCRDR